MSKIEFATVERIAYFLAAFPNAHNSEIIAHIMGTYGLNFNVPRWQHLIDCARGNI